MDAYIGGAWLSPATAEAFINGAWRPIQYAEAYISGAWRTIFTAPPIGGGGGGGGGGFTLDVSPSFQTVSGSTPTLTSGMVTATPSGGVGPYSYAWTTEIADGLSTINTPSLASTTVTARSLISGEPTQPEFQCISTDSLGAVASGDCSIQFLRS